MWTARALLGIMASVLAIGVAILCPDPADAAASEPQDALHEVMPGDNLHLIAGYYYGDARQWDRIWRANRAQIRNPNRIDRGALLRIPEAAVPDEPYPDFVARSRRSSTEAGAAGPTRPGTPAAPEVEVRIMGEPAPQSPPGSPPGAAFPGSAPESAAPGQTTRPAPGQTPSASPETSGRPPIVGAPGTLPARPIQPVPPAKGPAPGGS